MSACEWPTKYAARTAAVLDALIKSQQRLVVVLVEVAVAEQQVRRQARAAVQPSHGLYKAKQRTFYAGQRQCMLLLQRTNSSTEAVSDLQKSSLTSGWVLEEESVSSFQQRRLVHVPIDANHIARQEMHQSWADLTEA